MTIHVTMKNGLTLMMASLKALYTLAVGKPMQGMNCWSNTVMPKIQKDKQHKAGHFASAENDLWIYLKQYKRKELQ